MRQVFQVWIKYLKLNVRQIGKKLKENIPNKILLIAEAIRKKISLDKINKLSKIDPWFLEQISEIVDNEIKIRKKRSSKILMNLIHIKSIGFSDTESCQN